MAGSQSKIVNGPCSRLAGTELVTVGHKRIRLLGVIIEGDQEAILEVLDRDPGAFNQVYAFRKYKV